MQTILSLLCFSAMIPNILGDALGDFSKLYSLVESASESMLASLPALNATSTNSSTNASVDQPPAPTTIPFATAMTVQNISFAMGASQASYEVDPVAFINGQQTDDLDGAYFTMINEFFGLAQALVARGRAPHDELNMPVAQAIDGLARGVQAYSLGLTRDDIISDHSTTRSITVQNTLVDTERAWSYSVSYPAQKKRRSFVA